MKMMALCAFHLVLLLGCALASPPPAMSPGAGDTLTPVSLPSVEELDQTLLQWRTLSIEQRIVLEDMTHLLRKTLLLQQDPETDFLTLKRYFNAFYDSKQCAVLYLYNMPNARLWLYRTEQLLLNSEYWQAQMRAINRRMLGEKTTLFDPQGCL